VNRVPRLHLQLLDHVQAGTTLAPAPAPLQQPRKLAVLAYLVLEARPVPRAELATLLWGETTDESARKSLRQILHAIRLDCGFDPFIADRNFVRLDPRYVTCDVLQFYRALEQQQQPGAVVKQYDATFMRGFAIADARAFDDWCEQQRMKFDEALAEAAFDASKHCDDPRAALALLEIAAHRRPFEQSILRRRMRCLQQVGEVGAALSLYETERLQLREQTGASPAKETNDLAHELLNAARQAVVVPAIVMEPAEAAAEPARMLHGRMQRLRHRLRRRGGRLVGAAVLVASIYLGFTMSNSTQATNRDIPVVMLTDLTVSGADPVRRNEIIQLLSSFLEEDSEFALSRTNARASDAVLSLALDAGDGLNGTATLQSPPGTVLARVPIMYPAKSDAEAVRLLARQIRLQIAVVLARDAKTRNAAALDIRFDEVKRAQDTGAFEQVQAALAEIDGLIEQMPLPEPERRMLRSRWWESSGWLSIGRDQDFAAAVKKFGSAISALDNDLIDPAVRQRLVNLNLVSYMFGRDDGLEQLEGIETHASAIPAGARTPETWVRLAQAQYYLGKFQEVIGTGDEGRRTLLSLTVHPELSLIMFRAAFDANRATRASAECRLLRKNAPATWHAVACAAMAMGWLHADYDARQLLVELRAIEDREPARTGAQAFVTELIGAAAAHRNDRVLADSLLHTLPPVPSSTDQSLMRAIMLLGLQRQAQADELLEALRATSGGRRTLRSYARLIED
jgi:DNA-binding SARP family transcriptional activator